MASELAPLAAFLEAAVAAFSVLGGVIVTFSGALATVAYLAGKPPEGLTGRVNLGIVWGFLAGAPSALAASIIVITGS